MTTTTEEGANEQAEHVTGLAVPATRPSPGDRGAPVARAGLVSASEVLAAEPEPLRWTVAMLAYRGGLTIMAAPGESGKSTVALHTAASAAIGQEIAGLACTPGPALYVDGEGRRPTMHRRLSKMRTPVSPDLHMFFPSRRDPLNVAESAGLSRLEDAIRQTGATHVVLDSLTRLSGGIEDTSVEMGRAVGALADVASELDVAILVIHHSNRGGSWRGHSSVRDQADMLYVTSPDSTPQAMALRADKFRERDELPYHELRLSIGTVDNRTTILGPGVIFPKGETRPPAAGLPVVLDWIADNELGEIDRKGIAGALTEAWGHVVAPDRRVVRDVETELRANGWKQGKVGRRIVLRRTTD